MARAGLSFRPCGSGRGFFPFSFFVAIDKNSICMEHMDDIESATATERRVRGCFFVNENSVTSPRNPNPSITRQLRLTGPRNENIVSNDVARNPSVVKAPTG